MMYFLLYLNYEKLYEVVELYDVVDVDECIMLIDGNIVNERIYAK